MSSWIGTQESRWSLSQAIDALAEAARQGGRPGLVWIVGIFYPAVSIGLDLGWDGALTQSINLADLGNLGWLELELDSSVEGPSLVEALLQRMLSVAALSLVSLPLVCLIVLPFMRLVAGLARIAPAAAWRAACGERRAPRLSTIWAAGRGLTWSAVGIWCWLNVCVWSAMVVLVLPTLLALKAAEPESDGIAAYLLAGVCLGPTLILLVPYLLALTLLQQLALHSLAHNRRGLASALVHAWRIVKNDVPATARAVLVDFVLLLTLWVVWLLVERPLEVLHLDSTVGWILRLAMLGAAGVIRAGYWARAYRALGGLSPDDRVPGLGGQPQTA